MSTAPIYINIYAATLAFPLLNSLALLVIGVFMIVLGWLLIEQNKEMELTLPL